VDELFVCAVKVLNSKGYTTLYCCSGHTYDNYKDANAYIKFDEDVDLPNIPDKFKAEACNTIRKIFKKTEKITEEVFFREILKTANDVLFWATQLPNIRK
jgi:hypothetical protein